MKGRVAGVATQTESTSINEAKAAHKLTHFYSPKL